MMDCYNLVPQQGATLKEESQAWLSELTVCLSWRESSCHGFDSHGWRKIHRSNVHVMVVHPGTVSLTKQSCINGLNRWMDYDLRLYVLFNSISVISGQWLDDSKRLCGVEPQLWLERFPPQAIYCWNFGNCSLKSYRKK